MIISKNIRAMPHLAISKVSTFLEESHGTTEVPTLLLPETQVETWMRQQCGTQHPWPRNYVYFPVDSLLRLRKFWKSKVFLPKVRFSPRNRHQLPRSVGISGTMQQLPVVPLAS